MKQFRIISIVYLVAFICFEPVVSKDIQRQKRDVGTVISIVAELGPPVYGIIREYLKKKKCGKKVDSGMVNRYYNNNMQNSQNLKDAVSSRMAEAGDAVHMKASGYSCDNTYCEEMGPNARGTLGLCSRQYCVCKAGIAEMKTCGIFKVYDPMYNTCTTTGNAILCH